jgi:hypothetical protein
MDERFLNAHIDPAPFRLLGRSLYPWCLKYRVRLLAFKSPLVLGQREVTPADLLFACQVCAEEPLGGRIGFWDTLRLNRLNNDRAKFEAMLGAFGGYILVHDWPKFWEKDGQKSGGDRGIPWPLAVVANLIASGVPEKRAWEMPECQAIWLNTALAIRKGADVSVMTPEEEAFMESQSSPSNPSKETDEHGAVPGA